MISRRISVRLTLWQTTQIPTIRRVSDGLAPQSSDQEMSDPALIFVAHLMRSVDLCQMTQRHLRRSPLRNR
jgi:hypothetical protein